MYPHSGGLGIATDPQQQPSPRVSPASTRCYHLAMGLGQALLPGGSLAGVLGENSLPHDSQQFLKEVRTAALWVGVDIPLPS